MLVPLERIFQNMHLCAQNKSLKKTMKLEISSNLNVVFCKTVNKNSHDLVFTYLLFESSALVDSNA